MIKWVEKSRPLNPLFLEEESTKTLRVHSTLHLQILAQLWHLGLRITGWNHVSEVNIWKSNPRFF